MVRGTAVSTILGEASQVLDDAEKKVRIALEILKSNLNKEIEAQTATEIAETIYRTNTKINNLLRRV